jgi:hypothetical protein
MVGVQPTLQMKKVTPSINREFALWRRRDSNPRPNDYEKLGLVNV